MVDFTCKFPFQVNPGKSKLLAENCLRKDSNDSLNQANFSFIFPNSEFLIKLKFPSCVTLEF